MANKSSAPDSEIIFGDITYRDLRESLNLSDDYKIGSMAETYELLIDKKRVNPWLLRMKHGKSASPSSLASGVLPGIVKKYKQRKEEIIPLMEEIGISPKDFAILSEDQKKNARDHNDLRELSLVKVLSEKELVPQSYKSMHHHDLVSAILEKGGIEKFLAENDMKLPTTHKHLADSVAKSLIDPQAKKVPKKKDRELKRLASHHKKFNHRKRRSSAGSNQTPKRTSFKGRGV